METPIQRKLAKRIKELRNKCHLTQDKLSELTGLDYKYIQRIEGKNPPDIRLTTIERLAKALKTTPAKLLEL
ncbi:MAG: helix-turn-helix domain-containing protein [Candidatus Omnitrophica bacterium]|nr:helix-turn-helix domain-containing protein [Candidatus Omnitrophota bacterium]